MSRQARLRGTLAALIALAVGVLGPNECVPPPAASVAPPATASLQVIPLAPYALSGGAWYALVIIEANASAPLQAYDLELTWPPGSVSAVFEFASSFSDDNTAFAYVSPPDLAAGRVAHMIDLRHGPGSALGGMRDLALLVLRVPSPAPVWLQMQGKLARPDGTLFATTPSARVRLLPPP